MAAVTITLSDDELSLAREQAAIRGFTEIEDYLRNLLTECLHGDDAEKVDWGAPDEIRVTSREKLSALIEEGLNSPLRERTQADFDRVRQEIIDRHQSRGQQCRD
jgi:hypothetical protein